MTPSSRDLLARLPDSIVVRRVLAERAGEVVVEGTLEEERVAVRAMEDADSAAVAEWAALRALGSDAMAQIVTWGSLGAGLASGSQGRSLWVARRWIDGESLEVFSQTASDEAIGRCGADIFSALEVIHAAGIVHGDLSPGNVIVDRSGRAHLTDFGLASVSPTWGDQGATGPRRSGTPLFMAPEVLVGGATTEGSDYFSAAAVLALALARVQPDPKAFYGRFPAEPFLEALGSSPEALPEWARAPLTCLLERDPSARRVHTRPWASLIRSMGEDCGPGTTPPVYATPIGFLAGRSEWVKALEGRGPGLCLVTTADDSESLGLLEATAIRWFQRGRNVRHIDLRRLAQRAGHSLDLDRAISAELAAATPSSPMGTTLMAAVTEQDEWTLDALDMLGHGVRASTRTALVVFTSELSSARLSKPGSPWRNVERIRVPKVTRATLAVELGERIVGLSAIRDVTAGAPDHAPLREAWIDQLDRLGQGSVAQINQALRTAAELGAFDRSDEVGERTVALRPTVAPRSLGPFAPFTSPSETDSKLSFGARRILGALSILGGKAPLYRLGAVLGTSVGRGILADLSQRGHLAMEVNGSLQLGARVVPLGSLGLERAQLQALHRAVLDLDAPELDLDESSDIAPDPDLWTHLLGASSSDDAPEVLKVLALCKASSRRGLEARVSRGLRSAQAALQEQGRPLPRLLMVELARSEARSGHGSAAKKTARLCGDPSLEQEVDGILLHLRGDSEGSAKAFRKAGRPLQALAETMHAQRVSGDLEGFHDAFAQAATMDPEGEASGAVAWLNILIEAAFAAEDSGQTAEAWRFLDEARDAAPSASAPLVEGALWMNRAGLARRTGDLALAHRELERARRTYQTVGSAEGEANAQALLGTLLKDAGRLAEAEEPLLAALGRRSRLGRVEAAASSRGTLGLCYLERGHLRRALDELTAAHGDLERVGHHAGAGLIAAALDLTRARMGLRSIPRTPGGADGRVARWHAIARWIRGDGGAPQGFQLDPAWIETSELAGQGSAEALLAEAAAKGTEGRDALAARLAIEASVAANREELPDLFRRARQIAMSQLARVLQGLTDSESKVAIATLLGAPDPRPESLEAWRKGHDDEMDVMKILELNERLVRQEDSARLLGSIVEAALDVSGAERGFIVMSKDGVLKLDTAFASSRGDVGDEDVDYSVSIVREAIDSQRSLRVSDAGQHAEWGYARSVEDLNLRSILVAPFFVSPRVAGAVVVDDRRRPGAFGPREERLLELLAGQAVLAIRQVARLEENRALATALRERMATQSAQLEQANRALEQVGRAAPIEGLVGDSEVMESTRALLHRVARSEIAALITGPSGSGKELAARAIHALSERRQGQFVAENCAALPASLAEAELFGVKKGAFTGADADRGGLFERASGGTLFLDEVGELPPELQAKLLRVLETRRTRRVGETSEREVDFRLVSATNRDLDVEVQAGRFRADLMYRLDGVKVEMPSLEARREDIPALVRHFLALLSAKRDAPKKMSAEVLTRLMERAWPGNVRELANEVERLWVLSESEIIDPDLVRRDASALGSGAEGIGASRSPGQRVRPLVELERMAILDALTATGDDKRKAAELLGISRAKIYQRLKEWNEPTVDGP